MSTEQVFRDVKSSPQGLSSEEAATLLLEKGPNVLVEKAKKTLFMMFLDQFKDFMIIVLIVAAVIASISPPSFLTLITPFSFVSLFPLN